MHWNFLNTGRHPGAFNMEFDESLVQALAESKGTSTVRVYGWQPPAISLGWNQRLDEIDTSRAQRDGIDVVRRPTGGRAILHSEELTYSVAMAAPAKNILAVYNEISQALVLGLKKLAVEVALEKSQPHFPTLYQSTSSAACFSSSARYEIQISGRKLVGSAQRRYAGRNGEEIVLQHGSLLLGSDHKRLVDYLNLQNEADRGRLKGEIDAKTIDLSEALNRTVTFDECAEALKTGFAEAWGIRFDSSNLEPATTGAFS
jgi:lipoyl(octanoyl) transferase